MKHTCLAPALFLLCGGLNAQIQITSADMPIVGDEITRYLDTLPEFSPGGDGPDQSWDFSTVIQDIEQVNTFVDPASTTNGDQFSDADLALTTDGNNYTYIANDAAQMTAEGFSGDPLGDGTFNIVAPFAPALQLHQFPRQHTTAFSNAFGFDVTVDGSDFGVYQGRIKEVSSVYDTTDAYGSITTPVGTYDCIRSRNTTIRIDSVFAQLLEILPMTFLFANVDTTVTYAWHAVETKLPVAEMILDSLGNAVSFTWSSIEPNSTGVASTSTAANGLSIFPLPAVDQVRITVAGAARVSVTVSDLEGRIALKNHRLMANDRLDISALPSGVFVVSAMDDQGQQYSQRIVHVTGK